MVTFQNLIKLNRQIVVDQFGARAGNLQFLKTLESLGFSVPSFACLPIELSATINAHLGVLSKELIESDKNFKASKLLEKSIWNRAPAHIKKSLSSAASFSKKSLIIRGTSRLEGLESLSFAGVCYSHIPSKPYQDPLDIETGIKSVLAGARSPYGYYYKQVHKLASHMFDVGIIAMEMINNAIYYGTLYTYENHIGIRLMGKDMDVDHFYEKKYLLSKKNLSKEEEIIQWISKICYKVTEHFETQNGMDIEFLITKSKSKLVLWLVQGREIVDIHIKNYKAARFNEVQHGHIINTVGCFSGKVKTFTNDEKYFKDEDTLFIIKHQSGNGTFKFLSSLKDKFDNKIGCIILHANDKDDHLQYSVFEDPRLSFIFHARNDKFDFSEGSIISVKSDGFNLVY